MIGHEDYQARTPQSLVIFMSCHAQHHTDYRKGCI